MPTSEGSAHLPASPSFKSTSSSDSSRERGRQMKAPLWTGQFRKVGRGRRRQRVLHSEMGKGNYDQIGIKGGCVQKYFPTLPAAPPSFIVMEPAGGRPVTRRPRTPRYNHPQRVPLFTWRTTSDFWLCFSPRSPRVSAAKAALDDVKD